MNEQNDRPDLEPALPDAPVPSEETLIPDADPAPELVIASLPDADDLLAPRPLSSDDFTLSAIDAAVDDEDAWMRGDPADLDDGSDVDSALAAVASLSVVSDREADAAPQAPPQVSADRRAARSGLATPPLTLPKRGSLPSVGIGLLLIAAGAYWTFVSTTGGTLEPGLIALGVLALLVIAPLLAWLGSGRWARGLLFFAVTLATASGLIALMLTTPGLELSIAYPLLLLAPGIACLLTALIGRPAAPRLLLPGAVLIAAAAVGVAFNAGLIPIDLSGITALIPR